METGAQEHGILVTHSESVKVEIIVAGAGPGSRSATRASSVEGRSVIGELAAGGLAFAGEVTLRPKTGQRRVRASPSEPLTIQVTRSTPGESALLLIESDGVYTWRAPDELESSKRTRGGMVGPAALQFTLAGSSFGPGTRGAARNVVIDWILDKAGETIRAYAFKFIVRRGVKAFVSAYEKMSVNPGLVSISGYDPARWVAGNALPALPQGKPANILLMVHGTFSSTAGSFGALTSQPAGRSFLSSAYSAYDAVLGFDHSTLAEEPEQNAADIRDAISSLPPGSTIDTIAFSRGGLVARLLIEKLLPQSGLQLTPRRVLHVGCTNNGTHLAEPKNLEATLDLYTNLIIAGMRALSLVPGLTAPASAVAAGMRTVATLARYVAETAITDRAVPGLAAMQPSGQLVKDLNEATGSLGALEYYALTSSFEPSAKSPGFTKALKAFVLDRVTDRIFDGQNDLVVDTSSMAALGKRSGFLKGRDDYGDTSDVYHTIYFAKDRVARKLTLWLGLPAPPVNYVMPAVEIGAEWDFDDALAKLEGHAILAPVLIRRQDKGLSFYVCRVEDFVSKAASAKGTVRDTLDLRDDGTALHRIPHGDGKVGGMNFASWVRTAAIDSSEDAERLGDVAIDDDGIILGVRLPPRRSILVGVAEEIFTRAAGGRGIGLESTMRPISLPETGGDATLQDDRINADQTVNCEFAAEMPPYPKVGEEVDLIVTVSREAIEIVESAVAQRAQANVSLTEKIILQVIAKTNCTVTDPRSARIEIDVPPTGKPKPVSFKIKGSEAGPAELLVVALQGSLTLVSFTLRPVIVDPASERLAVRATAGLMPATRRNDRLVVRIYEISNGSETKLRFIVDSVQLNLNMEADSAAFGTDREKFIAGLFQEIEKAMQQKIVDYDAVERRLKRVGHQLWAKLAPHGVRKALWDNRNDIEAIQIISQEPFIPWELAVLSDPDVALASEDYKDSLFLAELGLVRWVQNAPWPGTRLRLGQGPLCYVAPQYPDDNYKLAGTVKEVEALKRVFKAKIEEVPASNDDVLTLVGRKEPAEILHFICHGEANTGAIWNASLLLAGSSDAEGYTPEYLTADDVESAAVLQSAGDPGSIVFLNACRVGRQGRGLTGCGGFAQAFLRPNGRRGASVFVGPLWNVNDEIAVTFAETFYRHLLTPETTLATAVKAARRKAREGKDPTWLAYSIYGDPFAIRTPS